MFAMGHSRPGRADSWSGHGSCAPKAEGIPEHPRLPNVLGGQAVDLLQAPKLEPPIMRHELSDYGIDRHYTDAAARRSFRRSS